MEKESDMSKKVEDIKKVGVVGAGTMGSGIAQVVATSGREVVLVDVTEAALGRGTKNIAGGATDIRRIRCDQRRWRNHHRRARQVQDRASRESFWICY